MHGTARKDSEIVVARRGVAGGNEFERCCGPVEDLEPGGESPLPSGRVSRMFAICSLAFSPETSAAERTGGRVPSAAAALELDAGADAAPGLDFCNARTQTNHAQGQS